jgi:hypothetical protein
MELNDQLHIPAALPIEKKKLPDSPQIRETILYTKEKCNFIVNKQVHTYNTRNNMYII